MEKRRARRITAGYKAEVICGERTFQGTVENLSETGVSVTIVSTEKDLSFTPGKEITVKLESHPSEQLELKCIIRWSTKLPPHGLINSIGVEIIDPPWDECKGFI